MPTTQTTVRTDLRTELRDTDASNYRWTDAELNRHIARAVREYSRVAPRELKATVATSASSRDLDITAIASYADLVKLLAVEWPVDKFPRRYNRFSFYKGVVTFLEDAPDGADCYLYYGVLHTLDASSSTLPERHIETVQSAAGGYAALAWAAYAANRVNLGGDAAVRDFTRYGKDRLRQFQEELRRLRSKVRATSMYPPYQGVKSQATDRGP